MEKVVDYGRVSSDTQDVALSIGGQLNALREFAAKRGDQVVRVFVDEGESGRTANRPAFKEMIALAQTKNPPFEEIHVWKMNRFSRSRTDSIVYKELLRKRGIKVVSITEPLEDSPSGKLLEGVLESIDEFYSANLGQDIKRGLREAARRGFFVGSRPPFGYHKEQVRDGDRMRWTLKPDPDDSPSVRIVRRIFNLASKDVGTKDIAKTLNRDGLFTGTGSRWGKTTVHKVLTNRSYPGSLLLGGRPGHKAIKSGETPVMVENAWPAIIDKAIFESVQSKLASRRPQERHPRTVPSFYLLSGLLFCSCGRAMIGRSAKSHSHYYYTCNLKAKQGADACAAKSLPKDKIEKLVIEQVSTRILNEGWLEELVCLVNEDLDTEYDIHGEKLQVIDAELNEARLRLARLYDVLETGKLNLDDLAPRIKELKTKADELSKARLLVEADVAVKGPRHVDRDMVVAYAADLRSLLRDSNIAESKSFLRTFVKSIVVDGDKVTVNYTLPVPVGRNAIRQEVLPMVPLGGPFGTVTELMFEKKRLIPDLQRLMLPDSKCPGSNLTR